MLSNKKTMKTGRVRTGLAAMLVLCAVLAYALVVSGGNLEPSGPPAPTMRTLNEIYNMVASGQSGPTDYDLPNESEVLGPGPMYMWIGDIEGPVTVPGNEGSILVLSVEHALVPTLANASVASDQYRGMQDPYDHTPLKITKRIDKSTPLLLNKLVHGENIDELEIRFWRVSGHSEQQYYTILLQGARVQGQSHSDRNIEEVTFVYDRIRWIIEEGSIECEDDWQ
jgi:type VI secretion system secreted protein Hcp